MAIVDDGNAFDCLRLTVYHGPIGRWVAGKITEDKPMVGAIFWVRVLGGITDEVKFADMAVRALELADIASAPKLMPLNIKKDVRFPNNLIAGKDDLENRPSLASVVRS